MGDFYITVQSDSSPNHFPTNTITTFRNHFATPILLNEPYQVALVECSYFHSSLALYKNELLATWTDGIRHLEYRSVRDINSWQELLDMMMDDFQLEVQTQNNYITACYIKGVSTYSTESNQIDSDYWSNTDEGKLEPTWTSKMKSILGYEHGKYIYPISMKAGQTNLYIYSDIADRQRVGSSLAPLLRKIAYKGIHNDQITHEFQHLHYIDVCLSDFENILMYIRTESGNPPPLQLGSFSATLHFRPKSY